MGRGGGQTEKPIRKVFIILQEREVESEVKISEVVKKNGWILDIF